jgi:hypothetical protein
MKIKYFIFALMLLGAGILVACGGSSTATSGFSQTYMASAGAGEVLQFSVDTTNLTYSYKVIQSSYSVPAGKTSTGTLSNKTAIGSYTVSVSADNFIKSGEVLPIQNGLLVGHVEINFSGFSGTAQIPVFGMSNPITSVANLTGTYNFQGFGCAGLAGGNVLGSVACLSHYGTIKVDGSGNFILCNGVDITATPACSTLTGTITTIPSTPGVFEFKNNVPAHIGWFIAFTSSNGQKVVVIDHDDSVTPEYGHTVASTQAVMSTATTDGNYLTRNNEGGVSLLTVSGNNITSHYSGKTGTLSPNWPWNGLAAYQIGNGAASGVAMIAGTGAITDTSSLDPALFGVGIKY